MQARDFHIGCVVCEEENRAVEFVVWIQDFGAREAIPPGLAVAIDNASPRVGIDLDIPSMC
jgi:hypothetical protein